MGTLPQPGFENKLAAILAICRKMHAERELGPLLDVIAREVANLLDCASVGVRLDATGSNRPRNGLAVAVRDESGEVVGVFEAVNKRSGTFTARDEELLAVLTSHAAIAIETARRIAELARENDHLWREVENGRKHHGIVGTGAKIEQVLRLIERIRDSVVNVLITGESGTGKDLVAKAIHFSSPRARKPFIAPNCGLPEAIPESFQKANGGTLFLDEIGDLSPAAQGMVVRALQEGVDVRLLAATTKDLEAEIGKGNFREDLYYRIKVIHIHLPPLREIREEIPLLANHFLNEYCRQRRRARMEFSGYALRKLTSMQWPGNVRQLRNEVIRVAECARGDVIHEEELWDGLPAPGPEDPPQASTPRAASLKVAIEELEREMIAEALRHTDNNQQQAARVLGLSRQGLINKMKRYAIAGHM